MRNKIEVTLILAVAALPAGLGCAMAASSVDVEIRQTLADQPWRNYRGIPYEEIRIDGKPADQTQADGIPDEDLKRFKVTVIPRWEAQLPKERFDLHQKKKYNNHAINFPMFHWFDERTLITEVWRLGDWEAADGELPKVILLDADTGQIKETQYRGQIACLKADRTLVLSLGPLEGSARYLLDRVGKLDLSEVRVGKLGDQLLPYLPNDQAQIVQLKRALLVKGTCEPEPEREDFSNGMHLSLYRLWPNGGYIGREDRGDFRLPPSAPLLSRNWVFFDGDKREIGRWHDDCRWGNWPDSQEGIQYQPTLGGYFIQAALRSGQFKNGRQCPFTMVLTSGEVVPLFYKPPLILTWEGNETGWRGHLGTKGNVRFLAMTAGGPIWSAERDESINPAPFPADNIGLYSLDGFRLIRILRGEVVRLSSVAPDGCRILIARAPSGSKKRAGDGDYGYFYRTATIESVNFCVRGK